ncbi:MAG: indole-3-glycerol phosphate synthase TrpC [Nitrospirota bacterium]|nr:indole-3-glycerol phosphate synthase TrpC [Nitrospirota bacterium]
MSILDGIIEKKRARLDACKVKTPLVEIRARALDAPAPRGFSSAIRRPKGEKLRLIAEIKKASPSKGLIREDFDPAGIAAVYEESGASAISVLTEEDFFQGSIDYMPIVKESAGLPVLRKDFIFDEYQVYEARANGADAILLIAAMLGRSQAEELFHLAGELGLSVLFEVHHWKELDTALLIDVPVIGINNRDLRTLEINLNTTVELLKDIPEGKTVVSESGIERREDVDFLSKTRVDALLIGTAFMKAEDIGKKVRELFR